MAANSSDYLSAVANDDEYETLPEPIKLIYSRKDWAWLTDEQKANATTEACEPETYFDS